VLESLSKLPPVPSVQMQGFLPKNFLSSHYFIAIPNDYIQFDETLEIDQADPDKRLTSIFLIIFKFLI